MKKNPGAKKVTGELRRLAEERLKTGQGNAASNKKSKALETQRLVHELQVHQIELELQNDELQRARAEVEAGLARYTNLYEFAPIGYLTLGRIGIIRQVNFTGARLLGLERAFLVGRLFRLLIAAKYRPAFDIFLVKVFASKTMEACEVVVCPGNGKPFPVELTGTVVEDGRECRIVATDISARKRAEYEREGLHEQLAQAQKMEAIGTLAGGIAHDFNNILGGILGGLSLLDFDLGEVSKHHPDIQEMKALVKRGADLTKQLLGFARRGKYDVKPLDLALVAEITSTMFGRTRKDITILRDIAPDLWSVLMDHTQLEQVLLNLFINAGQAMPEGGRLLLSAENAEFAAEDAAPPGAAPGRFVKFSVADTGGGMDAATLARIFEPFFTTKEPGQGTGLGLASVYGIIKSHAGSITVESALLQGTTFTLYLPATDLPAVALEVKAQTEALIQPGTGTILVVDDEEIILEIFAGLLQRIGYGVLTARSGKQAIELMREHGKKFALVMLDMTMPDMSGRQTYDALQEIAPGTKVLLCSGFSLEGQAQEILAHGCNGFIQKPFDAAMLSAKLSEILAYADLQPL
jgi:PAS domain S-box-containing protein